MDSFFKKEIIKMWFHIIPTRKEWKIAEEVNVSTQKGLGKLSELVSFLY